MNLKFVHTFAVLLCHLILESACILNNASVVCFKQISFATSLKIAMQIHGN
jgi:hypothetical protein